MTRSMFGQGTGKRAGAIAAGIVMAVALLLAGPVAAVGAGQAGAAGSVPKAEASGTVTAWGWNNFDQSTVPAGLTDVTAIAAGGTHSLALRADGSVVAWGDNGLYQTTVPSWLHRVEITAIAAGLGSESSAAR